MLDKIFLTVSSIAFVHTRRYNQHKMKVPRMSSACVDFFNDKDGKTPVEKKIKSRTHVDRAAE